MKIFNNDVMRLMEESSSSSWYASSSDGLSFIIEELDDEIIILLIEKSLNDETNVQEIAFLLQLRQATKQLKASGSRP